MSFFDKIISTISPAASLKRKKARYLESELDKLIQERKFDGASKSKRLESWVFNSNSANTQNGANIQILRERVRDLIRNNPFAIRGLHAIVSNTIGDGIVPQSVVYDIPGAKTNEKINSEKIKKADYLWRIWAESTQCDFERKNDIYGIQYLVFSMVVQDGECLIRRIYDNNSPLGFRIQILEADFLDTAKNEANGSNTIVNGVEFSPTGEEVAYWVFPEHPGGQVTGLKQGKSNRILSSEMRLIYRKDRAGQRRGLTWFHAVMTRLWDFDGLQDAQLMKQKISACFSAFVTTNDELTEEQSVIYEKLQPGTVQVLKNGQTVNSVNPPSVDGYPEHSKLILQAVAAGLGITYEVLSNDLSNVNFSSGRMGWLEFNRNIKTWRQTIIIQQLLNTVWEWFVAGSIITGKSIEGVSPLWTPPRREMIDPLKEIKANTEAIRSGQKTLSESIRETGGDPEKVFQERSKELSKLKELNIVTDSDPSFEIEVSELVDDETQNKNKIAG